MQSVGSSSREAWLQLWGACETGTWQLPSTHGRSMCRASAAPRPSCSGQWVSCAIRRWQALGRGGGCRWRWLQSTGTRCGAFTGLKTPCGMLIGIGLPAQGVQLAAAARGLLAANFWQGAVNGSWVPQLNWHCKWQLLRLHVCLYVLCADAHPSILSSNLAAGCAHCGHAPQARRHGLLPGVAAGGAVAAILQGRAAEGGGAPAEQVSVWHQ